MFKQFRSTEGTETCAEVCNGNVPMKTNNTSAIALRMYNPLLVDLIKSVPASEGVDCFLVMLQQVSQLDLH